MRAASVVAYGFLTCLIIIGSILFLLKGQNRNRDNTQRTPLPTVIRDTNNLEPVEVSLENGLALEDIAELTEKTIRGYLKSKTVEERIPWLRPSPGLQKRIEQYYAREGSSIPDGTEFIQNIEAVSFNAVPMRVVTTINPESGEIFPFTIVPSGDQMLIDWDSSVAYGEMEWDDYLKIRPKTPTQFRIFIAQDNYYNFEFSDDKRYTCFLVTSRFNSNTLYGYAERGSEIESILKKSTNAGESFPANVRLRFPKDSTNGNQVYIEELIHSYWFDANTLEKPSWSTE